MSCFVSRGVSSLISSKTHLSIFLVDQGFHKTFLQHHFSNFFYYPFILASLSHPQIVIENLRMWIILSLVSNETYLLLKIFPNSSIVVPLSLNLLMSFCFQAKWCKESFHLVYLNQSWSGWGQGYLRGDQLRNYCNNPCVVCLWLVL